MTFTTTIRTNAGYSLSGTFETVAEARGYALRWCSKRARRYPEYGIAAVVRDAFGEIVGRYGEAKVR